MVTLLLSSLAHSAEYEIKMLNYGDAGSMVFEPAFLHIQPGDTVKFVPTDPTHNTRSFLVPKPEKSWNSKVNEEFTITPETEGIYVYYCSPHLVMAMVGMIQVGEATNLEQAKKSSSRLQAKFVMNKQRVDELFAQVVN
ncbi:pseudoazurin [Marinomonas agarivorans]|nr:pseudoazurin [Marinomonas agarivorans]